MRTSSTNSPSVVKSSTRGSPSRSPTYQTNLALRTVIGTSTSNSNGFAIYEQGRQFAFAAGSTAVLADVDDKLNVSQRFFRARTSVPGSSSTTSPSTSHISVATTHSRPRAQSGSGRTNPLRSGSFGISEPTGGSLASTARDRVKAVTSVALSPNGRFIAAGETGYSPRVLIFSTAPDSSNDAPLSVMTEHSFGVKSIAFSPDSQFLATLGDINDGFLNVWAVNVKTGAAKLHSTNKCTSVVKGMCFVGNNVVTVGIRHIKAWRLDTTSPTRTKFSDAIGLPSPLSGRNCVLGNLGDSTFSCIASISDTEAIICTESGAICLYDDNNGHQKLNFARSVGFGIISVAYDSKTNSVWVGGKAQNMEKFSVEELRDVAVSSKPPSPAPSEGSSRPSSSHDKPAITCIGLFPGTLVTIDSAHSLRMCPASDAQEYNCIRTPQTAPAIRDPVMGISPLAAPNYFNSDFFTWSAGGLVNFWDLKGKKKDSRAVSLGQPHVDDDVNELKVVRTAKGMKFFVTGDKCGILSLFSGQRWTCLSSVRAHSAEITDIAIFQDAESCLIASCGRDRVVQLFKKIGNDLELVQTLEDHVGSVNRLLFMHNGGKLLSCSSDRTVVIRERAYKETGQGKQMAYFSARVITMKSTPVSMEPCPCDSDGVVVSSTDRYVHHYQITSGRSLHSFRASDPETGEAVIMSSLSVSRERRGQSPTLLVGLCSTDKSLRVYDFDRGTFLSGEFGHTEGVTDVILLENKSDSENGKKTLISTGLDGIIMIWDLEVSTQSLDRSSSPSARIDEGISTAKTVVRQPLRRVISKSEMTGFQKADGQTPATPANIRDTSPARTLRAKSSRTSLKSNSQPSRTTTSNLTTPTPSSRLAAATTEKIDRSPSPPRRRPTTSVGDTTRRLSMTSNVRASSISSSTTRLNEASRRQTARRVSINTPAHSTTSSSSSSNELSNINVSTERVCRTLKAYRKKLSTAETSPRGGHELETELKLTLKALEERAKAEKSKHSSSHLHFSKRLSSITRKSKHSYISDDSTK
ncbi:hypothetical protein KEM54_005394 [Ascosphaera aggregata]|nr:hypothetical protein KEM54_005394 [Ascosphaera aggregata]